MTVQLLTFPEVADQLGLPVTRVHQLVRDGQLIAVHPEGEPRSIPAVFLDGSAVVKALPSVITVLRDARFTDEEILDWLLSEDDSLPGSPIDALRANRGTEVKRRAQAAG